MCKKHISDFWIETQYDGKNITKIMVSMKYNEYFEQLQKQRKKLKFKRKLRVELVFKLETIQTHSLT